MWRWPVNRHNSSCSAYVSRPGRSPDDVIPSRRRSPATETPTLGMCTKRATCRAFVGGFFVLRHRQFLPPAQCLDRRLPLQRRASADMGLTVDQFDRAATAGVPRRRPVVMLLTAPGYVRSAPGVERAIGAPYHVNEPRAFGRFDPRLATVYRHRVRIPGIWKAGCGGTRRITFATSYSHVELWKPASPCTSGFGRSSVGVRDWGEEDLAMCFQCPDTWEDCLARNSICVFRAASRVGQGRLQEAGVAAFTIATMPARTASGRLSHRSTKRAKSADFRPKSAKQDAKSTGRCSEAVEMASDCVGPSADCKSAILGSNPGGASAKFFKDTVSGDDKQAFLLSKTSVHKNSQCLRRGRRKIPCAGIISDTRRRGTVLRR